MDAPHIPHTSCWGVHIDGTRILRINEESPLIIGLDTADGHKVRNTRAAVLPCFMNGTFLSQQPERIFLNTGLVRRHWMCMGPMRNKLNAPFGPIPIQYPIARSYEAMFMVPNR